ncbi:MAG: DNA polymerase III subunit gamma/tau, partial [Candidatus Levyibacteriota bacterium]
TCEQCVAITNGTSLDILEIDAASNRGIDEIRELKEKIRLTPVSAKKKVYIIDEVHMLTTEAFNALLKTLEEPPDHAMFILCTTEPQKIPSTILSRCFHISFKPATEEELVRAFKRIAKGEKLAVSDDALSYIAQLADRGFRDGVKILEEVSLMANSKPITKELIDEKYKVQNVFFYRDEMRNALQAKNAKESLKVIGQLVDLGIDLKYFLTQLMGDLHESLLIKLAVKEKAKHDSEFTIEELKVLFALLTQAYKEMKYAVLPQLPLELAILEWCSYDSVILERSENEAIESPKKILSRSMPLQDDDSVSVSSLRKQIGTRKKMEALYGPTKQDPQVEKIDVVTSTVALEHTTNDGVVTKEWLDHFWSNLIIEMKKYNHTVAGVLRSCSIKNYGEEQMIIQTAYKFHKERLDDIKNHQALLKVCKLLTGKDIEITIELKK